MEHLRNTHDLRLPKWGPYTKKYMGISHVSDAQKGLRFDLSIIPGFYRKKVDIPNVLWESGYHPWEAAADLSYYCHRHELLWKDQVYCDISFSKIEENARLIRCEYVNNTASIQNMVLHFMAYMNLPPNNEAKYSYAVELPENGIWIDSLDYKSIHYSIPRPKDSLVSDGLIGCEVRGHDFVNGRGLGDRFGKEYGNQVSYSLQLSQALEDGVFLIRYRLEKEKSVRLSMSGMTDRLLDLQGNGEFQTITIPIGEFSGGEHSFLLTALGSDEIQIDGFVIVPAKSLPDVKFVYTEHTVHPDIMQGPCENSLILKYDETDTYYGIRWEFDPFQIREFYCEELDTFMPYTVHDHVRQKLIGKGDGHFVNVFLRPIFIMPHSTNVVYGMVCSGRKSEVEHGLMRSYTHPADYEGIYHRQRAQAIDISSNQQGEQYQFSQRLMAATTLTNVVYPVYAMGSYIKHSTPGRWWDSLYTWDSGFIGLGLSELDIERAIDSLNAYVTEPGNPHAAFIHHGSPVPVQHYLFLELWNKTQSRDLLAFFYPRLRQYYLFLAGKLGSSTTRQPKSNLLKTWDYFYNSGGWDDYPPQVYVHKEKLTNIVTPVINTAHSIRTAKILRMAAIELGVADDVEEYTRDIDIFSYALQQYSWDEESGYFGYVVHDDEGNPIDILRHKSGLNYNMGLDGLYPLVAGICNGAQQERLLSHLFSDKEIWTEIGLSTVDRSAPYYTPDGYWNGAVWMPHQWFIWKTLLDIGKPVESYRIAQTGLDVWKNEVALSYNCFEHFIIQSGRGAGWHHFSGLSTPVLCWFNAYHRPGRLTCGFDIWIKQVLFSNENRSLTARLSLYGDPNGDLSLIASMHPDHIYHAYWNGTPLQYTAICDGVLALILPYKNQEGTLTIIVND